MTKLVGSIVFLLIAASLLASPHPVSAPFTTNSDGMAIVPATLGGTISMHVILDTGAGLDVLAPSLIEKVHGKPAGRFTGFRMTGERLDLRLFTVPEISIGPVVKRDAVVGSWDALDKMHMDGIVSLNDFRQQPITIDFAKKILTFETDESLRQRRASGKLSPLQIDDQRGTTLDIFARFLIGDQVGTCEIDTGSPNAAIHLRYMEATGINKDGKDVQKNDRPTISGAVVTRYDATMPQISLAAAPTVKIGPAHASFSDIIYDCVMGMEFWSDRALTIDIPNQQLIVSGGDRVP